MKKRITKVAVIGSGIMGSGIASHLAGIGLEVLLLDIAPKELLPEEEGLSLAHPKVKNRIVNQALSKSLKSKPSPIYHQGFASSIQVGNLDDDLHKIKGILDHRGSG
jgi:3-hydroxyacyl-CoA dehydrogenase